MAKTSEILVNGQLTQVTEFDHTAQEIDDAVECVMQGHIPDGVGVAAKDLSNVSNKDMLAKMEASGFTGGSNPNLIDNCYFADPINQRGLTEYSGEGYTIDRWKLESGTMRVTASGIVLNGTLVQFRESSIGQTVTASALTTTGVVGASYDDGAKKFTLTGAGETFVVPKLELGTVSTVAKKDASGTWVPNDPPPNKQQELAKCQRYFQVIPDGIAGQGVSNQTYVMFAYALPVPMRATPAFIQGSGTALGVPGVGSITPTSVSVSTKPLVDGNCVSIRFNAMAQCTAGAVYEASSFGYLSADL